MAMSAALGVARCLDPDRGSPIHTRAGGLRDLLRNHEAIQMVELRLGYFAQMFT